MNIGNAEMPSGFTEDDPADLFAGAGIGFGRVVNAKPVAQAGRRIDAADVVQWRCVVRPDPDTRVRWG